MTEQTIKVDVIVTDETAVAVASGPSYANSTGWAKKHPKDKPNQSVGFNLAMARALSELADRYAERAAATVGAAVEVGGFEYTPATSSVPHLVHLPDTDINSLSVSDDRVWVLDPPNYGPGTR